MPIKIKLLGICGSPIKGGNTETYLRESLKRAEALENVETEIFLTAKKDIRSCSHCNWCMFKSEPGKYCNVKDDLQPLFPKILEADAILFATPVYLSRMSGYMACVLDRFRAFMFGRHRGALKNKVGGALSVAWFRHGGIETAGLGIYEGLLCLEMIPVSVHHSGAFYGGGAVSSFGGTGEFNPEDKVLVLHDEWGLKGGRDIVARMVEVARIIKAGKVSLTNSGIDPHILSISKLARDIEASKRECLVTSPAEKGEVASKTRRKKLVR